MKYSTRNRHGNDEFQHSRQVKDRFNEVFADANKSAIVTQLLETAIEQAERKRRSDDAVKRVLQRRKKNSPITTEEALRTLHKLRTESEAAHDLDPH